jgi:hypothetical protein
MAKKKTDRKAYQELTMALIERSGGVCERCRQARGESVHHRKLRSRGGEHTEDNCVWLCGDGVRACHGWCHANPAEATQTGWMVPSWTDPAAITPEPL